MVRVKLRYLTCKLHHQRADTHKKTTTPFEILKAIKESIQTNFGDFGTASLLSSLQVRYYDEETQIFIVRCTREGFRSAWAAMTFLTSLGGVSVSISVLRVSGSVRTCREDALALVLTAVEVEEGKEGVEVKRGLYKSQIEGAIQGV